MARISSAVLAKSADDKNEPVERRMFQLTDLQSNHNKFYVIEIWPLRGTTVRFRATWGRVGAQPQLSEKEATWGDVERLVAEKLRKGYREVELHRPTVEVSADTGPEGEAQPAFRLDRKVAQLVDWIFMEAGEHILSFLAVKVDALSQEQITEGRSLLAKAQKYYDAYRRNATRDNLAPLAETVQAYYNTIPTKLPAKVDPDAIVLTFCKEFAEHEDRLLQLEAAVATIKAHRLDPGMNYYQSLGAEIKALSSDDPEYISLADYIQRTQAHGYNMKVQDIFSMRIPNEREAYERNRKGISRRELLFHGTRNHNVRHILRQGLICPQTPSHGRMLGNGIYLANVATKSANYCSSSRKSVPRMLLVVEAALGKCFVAPEARSLNRPPLRHDSVWGKAGHTRIMGTYPLVNDEFVVYSPAQQTIRYLVTFDVS
jgi:poly [ADP-ribose] polymerase 2/3/4